MVSFFIFIYLSWITDYWELFWKVFFSTIYLLFFTVFTFLFGWLSYAIDIAVITSISQNRLLETHICNWKDAICNRTNASYQVTDKNNSNNEPIFEACWMNSMSLSDWQCICNPWYEWTNPYDENNFDCKLETPLSIMCVNEYGPNSIPWPNNICICQRWYEFNTDWSECIREQTLAEFCANKYWINTIAWPNETCVCKQWFIFNQSRTSCIQIKTIAQMCIDSFWQHSIPSSNNQCACKSWYQFNDQKTQCIKIETKTYHFYDGNNIIDTENKIAMEKLFALLERRWLTISNRNKKYRSLMRLINFRKARVNSEQQEAFEYLYFLIDQKIKSWK